MSTPSPTVSPAPGSSPPATNGTSPPPASPSPPPVGNGASPLPSPTVPVTPPPVAAAPPPSNSPPPPSSESPPSPPPPDALPSPPGSTSPPTTPSPPSPPPPDARPSPPGSTSPPTTPSPPSPPPPDARPSPPSPPGSTSPPTTPSPHSPPPTDARPSPPGSTSPPTTSSPPSPPSLGSSRPPPSLGSISPPSPSNSNSTGIVMGAVIAGVFALVVVGVIFFCCCRNKKKKSDLPHYVHPPPPHKGDPYGGGQNRWPYRAPPPAYNVGKFPPQLPPPPAYGSRPPGGPSPQSSLPPPPAITSSGGSSSNYSGSEAPLPPLLPGLALGFSKNTFSLEELAMATDGFSDANLLGEGAFGYVHKGILPSGKEVAIKQLKAGSWQGEREFQAEVEIISRVHHRHLVSLDGYCIADGQKMLVYEFLPNKTLAYHLHGKGRPTLEWSVRQKIALGAAKGLAYLHEDCHPKIIHRDIKAANILLDYNFEAKVADFGLAKDAPDANTHLSTRVMGTFGYLAPEYASSGKVSYKSDVFSFGVMLLELITGRRPVNSSPSHEDDSLVNWAMPLLALAMEEGKYYHLVDPKLQNNYDRDEMARMVACAAGSVRHLARHRPHMSQIVRTLEGGVSRDSLNDGGIPSGHSRIDGSSDYDSSSQQYNTFQRNGDIKRHYQLAFESQDHGSSEYGGATSEYGLNPSTSSSEGQQTREMEMGSAKQG